MMNEQESQASDAAPGALSTCGEPSFTELNELLQERVNNLMADVDSILSKQIHAIRFPKQHCNKKQDDLASKLTRHSQLQHSEQNHSELADYYQNDETLEWHATRTSKNMSESLVRFFKGQITKLQTDLQTMQYEKRKMEAQCKYLEAQVRKKEENEGKIRHQLNCYKDSISKIESENSDMCLKVQAQSIQAVSLKKEIENLKIKLTSLNQISSNNELRLNRNVEENDKLRSSLKISQTEEKESREYIRKIQEEKRLALKALEKQRTEIFQAFKQQMQLVSNLKKQKLYLETNKQVQFIEKEFEKILEWKVT